MSASVYHTVLDCMRMQYSALSACMHHTSRLSVGVYHIIQSYVCRRIPYNACLQVYAIQRYICGHVPYIVFVCRCVPYHTELCLQVCTVQCLSAGVCHTALCLRACAVHRACLQEHTIQCLSAGVCVYAVWCELHELLLCISTTPRRTAGEREHVALTNRWHA